LCSLLITLFCNAIIHFLPKSDVGIPRVLVFSRMWCIIRHNINPNNYMQHLILLIILLLVAGLAYVPRRWPGGLHMTFSQHVARHHWSIVYYIVLFLASLPLLLWFFVAWFVPERGLPDAFIWFAAVAVVFQVACTFVPETGGIKTTIHRILTGISGITMLPLMLLLVTDWHLSTLSRVVAAAALVGMLILLSIALTHQKGYHKALLLQVGYYTGFFVAILTVTYIS